MYKTGTIEIYSHRKRWGTRALMTVIFLALVSRVVPSSFENANCIVVEEKADNFNFLTSLRLMEESVDTINAKIETIHDKTGNFPKQRAIINTKPGPLYDGVMALTLSADGKHYAYTALLNSKIFPVIDGKPQKNELSVDTECCGEGGHWFEVWQYTEYIFSDDGKRTAFLEINEDKYSLILDGKVVDTASILGDFRFSPNGKFLAYFTKEPDIFPKAVFLVVNGEKIWEFEIRSYLESGGEKVKIESLENDSITALGYNNGKPVRVTCNVKEIGEW